jgi:hypothetical protein
MASLIEVSSQSYRMPAPDRPTPLLPLDPYLNAWATLRRWRRIALVSFCSLLPVAVLSEHTLGAWWIVIVLPAMAFMFVASGRVTWFRCPNCREFFGLNNPIWGPVSPMILVRHKCLHCGIRKGTPKVPS